MQQNIMPGPYQTFQPNQLVVNPADGKNYQVQQQTPGQGVTLIDPQTQQQVMVSEQDSQNLKPSIKTSLLEQMVDDLLKEKEIIAKKKEEKNNKLVNNLSIESIANEIVAELTGSQMPPTQVETKRRMPEMFTRWNETRKRLRTRSMMSEVELKQSPTYRESRQERAIEELGLDKVAVKGYDPYEGDLIKEVGRDKKTGLPMRGGDDIEVGLTEFPKDVDKEKNPEGYSAMTMEEMDDKFEEEHDHFKNEQYLPDYTKKREESDTYLSREDRRKKVKDLREDFPKPRYSTTTSEEQKKEAMLDSIIGLEKKADDVTKLPVQFKDVKKAPGSDMGYTEPEVLPQASPDVKAAIELLKTTEEEIKSIKTTIDEKTKPLQQAIMDATKELNTQMAEKAALLKSCLDILYDELSKTEDKVAVIGDEIYTALDREKATAPAASLAQILKKAQDVNPKVVEEINKIKAVVEAENTKLVLEQYIYKYPVSEVQKKKISRESTIDTLVQEIVGLISSLTVLNEQI